jgi:hypothetical protein
MPAVRGYYFDDTREMIYAKNAMEAISRRFSKNVFSGAVIQNIEFKPLNPENIEAVFWFTLSDEPVTVFLEDTCSTGPSPPPGKFVSLMGQPHRLSSYYIKYIVDTISHSAKSCVEILWDEHHALVMCSADQARYLAMLLSSMCTEREAIESIEALRQITKHIEW